MRKGAASPWDNPALVYGQAPFSLWHIDVRSLGGDLYLPRHGSGWKLVFAVSPVHLEHFGIAVLRHGERKERRQALQLVGVVAGGGIPGFRESGRPFSHHQRELGRL